MNPPPVNLPQDTPRPWKTTIPARSPEDPGAANLGWIVLDEAASVDWDKIARLELHGNYLPRPSACGRITGICG